MSKSKAGKVEKELREYGLGEEMSQGALAKYSAIDARTLNAHIGAGRLIASRDGNRGYRITMKDAVAFFIAEGEVLWDAAACRRADRPFKPVIFTAEELATEVWRKPDVRYFKPELRCYVRLLEVSNLGRVRNATARRGSKKHSLLKPRDGAGWYLYVAVGFERTASEKAAAKAEGRRPTCRYKNLPGHRLVAAAFHPNPQMLPHVNHGDGNRWNNRAGNLAWSTPKANIAHARKNGGVGRSEGRPATKLSPAIVKEIRESDLPAPAMAKLILKKYGIVISVSHICRIRRGEQWRGT